MTNLAIITKLIIMAIPTHNINTYKPIADRAPIVYQSHMFMCLIIVILYIYKISEKKAWKI